MIVASGIVTGYEWQPDLRFMVRLDIRSYTTENYSPDILTSQSFSVEDPEGLVNAGIYAFVRDYITNADEGGWGMTFDPTVDRIEIINPYQKAPASVALSNNFSAAWNMPEDTGTPRAGAVGPDLTEVGTVGREAMADGGWAAFFDGDAANHLTIANAPDLASGDFDFCYRLSVKDTAALGADVPFFSSWNTALSRMAFELWRRESDGMLEFRVHNGTSVDTYATTFHIDDTGTVEEFIVLWHEAATNTIRVQVNADTVQSFVLTAPIPSDSDTFSLGVGNGGTSAYYGTIRRFGYGRFNPTAADRAIMYNAGLGQDWPFEELAIVPMPTGTGFTYNMNGVQASAAKLVDLIYDTYQDAAGNWVLGHLGAGPSQLVQVTATQLLDTLTTAAIDNKIPIRVAGVWVGGTLSDIINQSGISTADGDMLVRGSAGIWTRIPKGTAGQVLTMNAGGTLPEWQ